MFSEFGSIDSVTLVSENGQSAASMILSMPVSILSKFENLCLILGVFSTVSSFIVLDDYWRIGRSPFPLSSFFI